MDVLEQARNAPDPNDPAAIREALRQQATEPDDPFNVRQVVLTPHEAAVRLGWTDQATYLHLKAGTFPARARKAGKFWQISAEDVDRLLAIQEGREDVDDPAAAPTTATQLDFPVPGAGAEASGAIPRSAAPPVGDEQRPPPPGG